MNRISRSPRSVFTYANVMATVAVFIALGGSSYAAVKLNGKDIKKNTVAGKALKKNTLGGREINEAKLSLPKVASASSADSALTAALANRATSSEKTDGLDGATVKGFNTAVPPTPVATVTTIYSRGGLTIEGLCSDGSGFPDIRVVSSTDGSLVYSARTVPSSTTVSTILDGLLDDGESVDLDLGTAGSTSQYNVTLRTVSSGAATVLLTASKNGTLDGAKCRYTGVAFGL